MPPPQDEPLGVYLHIPFCGYRCAYCDFAIVTGQERRAAEYTARVVAEIAAFAAAHGRRAADTVHFGGGTPSRIPAAQIGTLLEALAGAFDLAPAAEIALEANPDDIDAATLAAWRASGVNRLSVGVQALRDDGLVALGRPGTVADARRALELAAAAGFDSIGADLIFGRPGQTPEEWAEELSAVVDLPVGHLSLYALETDARTPLVRAIEEGRLPPPDDDRSALMYEFAVEHLAAAGFARYEVSNFARPGHVSRHNRKYWTDQPYAGFGQSASGYVDGARSINPRRYSDYLRGAAPEHEPYDPDRRCGEALVFGLRLAEGVDFARLAARHGADPLARRRAALDAALADGRLVRTAPEVVRLADHAVLTAHEVLADLL